MLLFLLFAPIALAELGGYRETPERQAIMHELRLLAASLDERSVPCENLDQLSRATFDRAVPRGCPELESQMGKIRDMDRAFRTGCYEHFAKLTTYMRDPNLCGPQKESLREEFLNWDAENRKLHQQTMNEFEIQYPSEAETKKDQCNFAWNIIFNGRKKVMGLYGKNKGTTSYQLDEACTVVKPGEQSYIDLYFECLNTGEGC